MEQIDEFAPLLALAKTHQKSQWAIGDELIRLCGPAGDTRANSGSIAKIEAARAYLAKNGIQYRLGTLQRFREIASAFPHPTRGGCGWYIHRAAGNPETLAAIIKGKPEGQPLTVIMPRRPRKPCAPRRPSQRRQPDL